MPDEPLGALVAQARELADDPDAASALAKYGKLGVLLRRLADALAPLLGPDGTLPDVVKGAQPDDAAFAALLNEVDAAMGGIIPASKASQRFSLAVRALVNAARARLAAHDAALASAPEVLLDVVDDLHRDSVNAVARDDYLRARRRADAIEALVAENARLREALRVPVSDAGEYEGRLEASLYVPIDTLELLRAFVNKEAPNA